MALRREEQPDVREEEFFEADMIGRPGPSPEDNGEFANDNAANDYNNSDDVRDAESSPRSGGWKSNVGNAVNTAADIASVTPVGRGAKVAMTLKKRGPALVIVGLLGIAIMFMVGFFGPATMIINIMSQAAIKNDTTSKSFNARFLRPFKNMTDNDVNTICANGTKSIKCKMGRISNKALHDLNKKGVIAVVDGVDYDGTTKRGYPSKNPEMYKFPKDGGGYEEVDAKNLQSFLADKKNRVMAAKVLGTGGAFNMRLKVWAGNHMNKAFYSVKKFGLKKRGGLADGTHEKGLSFKERAESAKSKVRAKIPSLDRLMGGAEGLEKKFKQKVGKSVSKLKKGGVAYAVAAAGCISAKLPGYIAATVAAVQLKQLLPYPMEIINSPGGKLKISGVDPENAATPEDMDAIGAILTHQTRNQNGEMTSALDSIYLQYAMGVNTTPPIVHEKFTPGYAAMQYLGVEMSQAASKTMEPFCNVILSPAAMWAAIAASAVVAAATGGIGGLINWAGGMVLSEIIAKILEGVGIALLQDIVNMLAENGLEDAEGEALGDALGIGLIALYGAGGMSRHLPVLKKSEVPGVQMALKKQDQFEREMDIASLSPFDTSSRHTFLGSIVYNTQLAILSSGGIKFSSIIPGMFATPSLITSTASAQENYPFYDDKYCDYAEEFGLATEEENNNPAISVSGLPCVAALEDQLYMSTEAAIDYMISEEWICNPDGEDCPEIGENDTIFDLMPDNDEFDGNGYIKEDNPLYEFIASCSDASTGDYLLNSGGCVVDVGSTDSTIGSTESVEGANGCVTTTDEDGNSVESCGPTRIEIEDTEQEGDLASNIKDPNSLRAIVPFLMDYQTITSVNGEDTIQPGDDSGSSEDGDGSGDEDGDGSGDGGGSDGGGSGGGGGGGSGSPSSDWVWPSTTSAKTYRSVFMGKQYRAALGFNHMGVDMTNPMGQAVVSACNGTVIDFNRAPNSHPVASTSSNAIIIDCGGGIVTTYNHTPRVGTLKVGDTVKAGQHIGNSDCSGICSGAHLHFNVRQGGTSGGFVDPIPFLRSRGVTPGSCLSWCS